MADKVAAILLAAGYSSRMGSFKPLLPLGKRGEQANLLERNVRLFRDAGVSDVRVVIGHRAEELMPLLESLRVEPVFNPDYRSGMFSSVVAGVASLDETREAFFLLPVDIPLVRRRTVMEILSAGVSRVRRIVYPTFRARRGHPPLISSGLREEILSWSGEGGLKGLLDSHEGAACDIEVADEGILLDMDTPTEYRRLLERSGRMGIPTAEECRVLLENVLRVEPGIRAHCEKVAELAALLASELSRCGHCLDVELLTAAGLLHDLARREPDHARSAAAFLRELEYGAVAELVAGHMDMTVAEGGAITPGEVLYLADKLVKGDRIVTLKERFSDSLERHAHEPEIMQKIRERLKTGQTVQARLEKALGRSLSEVLKSI